MLTSLQFNKVDYIINTIFCIYISCDFYFRSIIDNLELCYCGREANHQWAPNSLCQPLSLSNSEGDIDPEPAEPYTSYSSGSISLFSDDSSQNSAHICHQVFQENYKKMKISEICQ